MKIQQKKQRTEQQFISVLRKKGYREAEYTCTKAALDHKKWKEQHNIKYRWEA